MFVSGRMAADPSYRFFPQHAGPLSERREEQRLQGRAWQL
jgi:hypothetical protein